MKKIMLNVSRPIWLLISIQRHSVNPTWYNWDSFSKGESTARVSKNSNLYTHTHTHINSSMLCVNGSSSFSRLCSHLHKIIETCRKFKSPLFYIPRLRICLLILEREEGRERDISVREKCRSVASGPQLGIGPTTSVCALSRNWTGKLLMYGTMLQSTESPGQGQFPFL